MKHCKGVTRQDITISSLIAWLLRNDLQDGPGTPAPPDRLEVLEVRFLEPWQPWLFFSSFLQGSGQFASSEPKMYCWEMASPCSSCRHSWLTSVARCAEECAEGYLALPRGRLGGA